MVACPRFVSIFGLLWVLVALVRPAIADPVRSESGFGRLDLPLCDCTPTAIIPTNSMPRVLYPPPGIPVIELRKEIPPNQGINLGFTLAGFSCPGGFQSIKVVPESGTGPVLPVHTGLPHTAYLPIDNFAAPGNYYLEIKCGNESACRTPALFTYAGFRGYVSSGTLRNAITGNTIRGAGVSIWQQQAGGGYQLYSGQIAGDGTYSFDVPAGVYKVLVQYELAGEQWRGPFTVGSTPASPIRLERQIPYEDIDLTPVTDDAVAPEISLAAETEGARATVVDRGVGLAVVEAVPGTVDNVFFSALNFVSGEDSMDVMITLQDPGNAGSITLRTIDRLGNVRERDIVIDAVGVDEVNVRPGSGLHIEAVVPNPSRGRAKLSCILPTAGWARVTIHDVQGRLVAVLADEQMTAGRHWITWDARGGGARPRMGLYLARIQVDGKAASIRLALLE